MVLGRFQKRLRKISRPAMGVQYGQYGVCVSLYVHAGASILSGQV